jgi:hypothetical protein
MGEFRSRIVCFQCYLLRNLKFQGTFVEGGMDL